MEIDINYQRSSHRLTTDVAHASTTDIARSDADAEGNSKIDPGNRTEHARPENEVFYVQSASSQTTTTHPNRHRRRHVNNLSPSYEVRLAGWNCTCPAFAFSAYGRTLDFLNSDHLADVDGEDQNCLPADDDGSPAAHPQPETDMEWRFGGSLTHQTASRPGHAVETPTPIPVPVCKHILAAILGKHAPVLFGSGVHFRTVSPDEGAAWAGGWGDGD